jgi:glycosyltransferase involved in cell wall biosynthesis
MTMKKEWPLVTIIIACYQSEKYLEEAILSVLYQTYKKIELIIIDGGSTDMSPSIIKKYSTNISYTISEKDSGVYDAWNKGLKKTQGEWIVFLGSDDVLLEDTIQKCVDFIGGYKGTLDFLSSRTILCDANLNEIEIIGEKWSWKVFSRHMNTSHIAAFHNKKLFCDVGYFNLDYKIAGDYELLLRKKSKLKAAFLDACTAKMRFGGLSNKSMVVLIEAFKAKHRSGGVSVSRCFFDFCVALTKFYIKKLVLKYV